MKINIKLDCNLRVSTTRIMIYTSKVGLIHKIKVIVVIVRYTLRSVFGKLLMGHNVSLKLQPSISKKKLCI